MENDFYIQINQLYYSWTQFISCVNEQIYLVTNTDDKKMGNYFINPYDLIIEESEFVEKTLFYLWNNVFKNEELNTTIFEYLENKQEKTFKFTDLFSEKRTEILESFMELLGIEVIKEIQNDEILHFEEYLEIEDV